MALTSPGKLRILATDYSCKRLERTSVEVSAARVRRALVYSVTGDISHSGYRQGQTRWEPGLFTCFQLPTQRFPLHSP
ncbi:hypothetical protein J6590_023932 [Homalodisca vitripennis]|nr:hypothetical protein J6590_023932 [Homalodisca vitripennis]